MKTGKELILDIPNGVRRNFILNLAKLQGIEEAKEKLISEYENLYNFISSAFIWQRAKEGHNYWLNVSRKHGRL